ncbi:MAG: hypothetical protein RIS64_2180 [Bacteroidota bacterium]|jgi:hypothetical protein
MKLVTTVLTGTLLFSLWGSYQPTALKSSAQGVEALPMPPAACENLTGVAKVVCLADAFKATLSSTQLASVEIAFTMANAIKWSNLPGAARNGLKYNTLSATQLAAALAVIQAAAGTTANDGFGEYQQIRWADTYLGTQQAGYSEGTYIIAFLGTPSTSGKWMLQFGGHHYAQNITFDAGRVVSVTPSHQGVEPLSFTSSGTTYTPLQSEQAAMLAMLSSLSAAQLTTAKLGTTFSDVLLGPNKDGQFPATKLGLKCSTLSAAQKAFVIAAMKPWLNDAPDEAGSASTTLYSNELDETYIAYSGNATLANNADYVRIDGPSVWIELVCQSGVVFSGIHYHAIYRDHTRDYGAGTSITPTKEVFGVVNNGFTLSQNYPNPFDLKTTIPFSLQQSSHVNVTVFDLSGRQIVVLTDRDMEAGEHQVVFSTEQKGMYLYKINVQNSNGNYSQAHVMANY